VNGDELTYAAGAKLGRRRSPLFGLNFQLGALGLKAILAHSLFNQDSKVGDAESVVNYTPTNGTDR
jgi:hypothetical protein